MTYNLDPTILFFLVKFLELTFFLPVIQTTHNNNDDDGSDDGNAFDPINFGKIAPFRWVTPTLESLWGSAKILE